MSIETRDHPDVVGEGSSEAPIPESESIEPVESAEVETEMEVAPPWPLRALGMVAGVVVGLVIIALVGGSGRSPGPVEQPGSAQGPPVTVVPPPADTLGITFADLRDQWNALERPPFISTDLRRVPEAGPFDSFSHRFDSAAVVAGAYDPDTDYLVALMVRSSIDHPNISNMYLHLCYLVDPYSQGCIDDYFELGLGGKRIERLAKLSAEGHVASWDYQGNHWTLTVGGNIQTIRVMAPGAD